MSFLFRTSKYLTIAQLTGAWGPELARVRGEDPLQCQEDLTHVLLQDIFNGRLDDAGPVWDDRRLGRLGVACITVDNKAACLEGRHLLDFMRNEESKRWLLHDVLVVKEAILDFARRHQLPPPTWWAEVPGGSMDPAPANADVATRAPPSIPNTEARPRGRRPEKRVQVEEAMKRDIQRGRLTLGQMEKMGQEALAATYGVNRETARKALAAVASQVSPGSD